MDGTGERTPRCRRGLSAGTERFEKKRILVAGRMRRKRPLLLRWMKMKLGLRWIRAIAISFFLLISISSSAEVLKIVVNDTIQPITEEYIARAIAEAQRGHDQALLIELNTPGGLLDSTRDIIHNIVTSPVPVIIYVSPAGRRAASAGFFILESADIAAMAPGTNTG